MKLPFAVEAIEAHGGWFTGGGPRLIRVRAVHNPESDYAQRIEIVLPAERARTLHIGDPIMVETSQEDR